MWFLPNALAVLSILSNLSILKHAGLFWQHFSPVNDEQEENLDVHLASL